MEPWKTAFLSIGSNKGDKRGNLVLAVDVLTKDEGIRVERVSEFYKTAPQNYTDQDWFVNAALKIKTQYTPVQLLDRLKMFEREMDREGKPFRFGPRIIDLDIIDYDGQIIRTERLELPHPRMHERCFVLKPLCDIGANLVHPVLNQTTDELLKQIETDESQAVIALAQEEFS
ncbi:MAG: 2-amino-4-hydroxy-6-hydroxymethyldihydropteridine diphosphokinase [Desulfobacter sp.]|nr:MAG: 2-amino-4-hydroxy-6-hydroxymethyldihydropteridine diphosphokinase [Desulfobacter sp.]